MGKRLCYTNLQKEYPDLGKRKTRKVIKMEPLLQKDYGERLDCTITSLACIFGKEHYSEIEAIAKKFCYDGNKKGTNPLTVRKIMMRFMDGAGIRGHAYSSYGKLMGWTYGTIRTLIGKGLPIVLNLWTDGRSYYKDHSVTVVGYEEYEHGQFLLVYDNWNLSISMIDYQKLSAVSSINWTDAYKSKG